MRARRRHFQGLLNSTNATFSSHMEGSHSHSITEVVATMAVLLILQPKIRQPTPFIQYPERHQADGEAQPCHLETGHTINHTGTPPIWLTSC